MRTLAIGDIHGCSTALRTLLDAVQPGADDLVITLGDYVDRGPDARGVFDTLLALQKRTQLKSLTGNHEILFMEALGENIDKDAWMQIGGKDTMRSYSHEAQPNRNFIPKEHLDFVNEQCLRYWEIDTHFFVHANANAVLPLNEQTDDWLFWTRFDDAYPHVSGKTMVCGHTAQRSGLPAFKERAICIDTWVYGEGWLTCLHVETGEMTQANQAGNIRHVDKDGKVKG